MYAVVCCTDVRWGTTRRTLYKPYWRTYVGPPDVRYFLNTLWIIPGRTRQPLNHWARTTDVHPLAGCPLLSGPINRALPPRISHSFQNAPRLPKCFQSVSKLSECLVSVRVRNIRNAELLQFCFKEVTFDP
jgi:hypothetical protein